MIKLPNLESYLLTSSSTPKTEVDVIGVTQENSTKSSYQAVLDRILKAKSFTGKLGTTSFVRFGGKGSAEHVLFVGLGSAKELTEEKARVIGATAYSKLLAEKTSNACFHLDTFLEAKDLPSSLSQETLLLGLGEGFVLPAYEFKKYKLKSSEKSKGQDTDNVLKKAIFATKDKTTKLHLDKLFPLLKATAEAVCVTRDWSNEPSNYGTPEYYASEARKLAKSYGLQCKVLSERDCAREKMGLFLAVGQGAEREGKFVIVEYKPKGVKNTKTLALVGKGVTFDSGGISIKPSTKMEEMKHDMTGAATVMGAVLLASKMKVPTRVIGIMAFTENMPDGNAIQPGNIVKGRSGKSVEIWNTDAEGRLILADALDYAHDFKPDAIIDVATLTGAVGIALGRLCCAVLGNNDALIEKLKRIGDTCGERMWQLPLYDEYFDDLKSDCADMKNIANDSFGGTIRGAMFLRQFIKKDQIWAHLDIAYTAQSMNHLPYCPKKGASGLHVRTLARFAAEF